MNVENLFRPLIDLERSLADLYEYFSGVFSSDPELAFIFFKMAAEEKGHASLVEYQKRLVQRDRNLSIEVDADLTVILEAISRVRSLRSDPNPPTVADAIRFTLLMETSAAESHYKNALRSSNPEIARLLQALGGEDKAHIRRMQDLAEKRGFDIPALEEPEM